MFLTIPERLGGVMVILFVWFNQIKTYSGELLSGRTLISAKY